MKRNLTPMPCSEWAEKLAARHPDDLSAADASALHEHLKACPACSAASAAYAVMETSIRALPPAEPLQMLPAQFLLQGREGLVEDNRLQDVAETQGEASLPILLKQRENTPSISRRLRLARLANMAAAVLIVGVIVISSVLLFASHHSTTTTSGHTSQAPLLMSPYHCEAYIDAGVHQVCQDKLVRAANLSKTIGGYRITIDGVYADANRVVIIYRVIKIADGKDVIAFWFSPPTRADSIRTLFRGKDVIAFWFSPTTQQTNPLTTRQGTVLPYRGGTGWLSNNPGNAAFFDAASIPENTRELSLHLDIGGFEIAAETAPNGSILLQSPVTFDFAVPFHSGRVANLHQTVTSGGKSITLERVVVSLSETRLYLQGGSSDNCYTLAVDGRSSTGESANNGGYDPSSNTATVFFDYPLFDKQGTWTLRITGKGGPWVFHFVVPPAAAD